MIIETGRAAVWSHCEEAGIQDDIKMISKYFDNDERWRWKTITK